MDKGNNWFIIFVHQLPEATGEGGGGACQSVGSLMGKHFKVRANKEGEGERFVADQTGVATKEQIIYLNMR